MKITATKITTIYDAHAAIESTMHAGFQAKAPLDDIYRWGHSPARTQLFWIVMGEIPTKVSVHLVRHAAVGQQHYVMSNRPDRGGPGDDEVTRNSPVNHRMLLNAEHLIDMARRRLCCKASVETRAIMEQIRQAVAVEDPDLARYMVRQCVYRGGYCSEPKPCGHFLVRRYDPEEIWLRILPDERKEVEG